MDDNQSDVELIPPKSYYSYLTVAAIAVILIILSLLVFAVSWQREQGDLQLEFERTSRTQVSMLESQTELHLLEIESLAAFFAGSIEVERYEFTEFVNIFLRAHRDVHGLAWAPRVTEQNFNDYIESAQKDGFEEFQITERDPNGLFIRAQPRDEYFPVYFIEPIDKNKDLLGFNLSSNPTIIEALIKSGTSGKQAATARLKCLDHEDFVFLILQPVYIKDGPNDSEQARLEKLQGFIVGFFHVSDVVKSATELLGNQGVDMFLYDISATPSQQLLYGPIEDLSSKQRISLPKLQQVIGKSIRYEVTINVAGRQWTILCSPSSGYFEPARSLRPWLVLATGILLTFFITVYLAGGIKRTQYIESEVRERTAQLQKEVAERKRAELALRLSEQCFRAIADYTYFLEIWVSPTGRPLWVNPAVARITGYSVKEFLELPDYPNNLVVEEDRESISKAFKDALNGQSGKELEFRLRKKDGTVIWADMTWQPIYDQKGISQGHRTSIRDITRRKRAEKDLLQSEEKFSRAFQNSPAIMAISTFEEGRFAEVNDEFLTILGYSRDEVIGKNSFELGIWEDISQRDKIVNTLKEKQFVRNLDVTIRAKGGRLRYGLFSCDLIYMQDQLFLLTIMSDITDRKAAEEELKLERDKAQRYLDIAAVMLVAIDKNQNVSLINKKGCEILGYSEKDILGKNWFDRFVPERFRETVRATFYELIARRIEPVEYYENPVIDSNGRERIIAWHNTLLTDEYGNITGTLSSGQDVTEAKSAAEEREKLLKTLDAKNKELESIIYVASHDLRSPLVNIQGFSHELNRNCQQLCTALESGSFSSLDRNIHVAVHESIPESLHYILTSADKMDNLLNGLLVLSRLSNKAITFEKLDMNALLADIIANMEFQIKQCNADVKVSSLPDCVGDPSQINQVFTNLLGNALKYLDESRPGIISVSGCLQDEYSIYCVEDNGIGIEPEYQNKIFEIFHRLEPDTKTGEGLGLTIVRRIVERHNGKVWVESQPGLGSKFFVSLPGA